MKNALMLSLALGVALAQPAAANPLDRTTMPAFYSWTIHHHGNFAKATALAAALPAVTESEKMKGLSRDADDCNYGCIDH